ncbi:UNVERIFIED_CONTAM: hypothetical protein HDU68_006020 [Siphonaria sp. JEL0065]|nr:hypothetical protein HDU68_006020 [Siphonaria sp. JEL0065]
MEQTPLLVPVPPPTRLAPLDLVRGVLMVFMAIDHSKGLLSNFVTPHEQWFEMPDYKGNVLHFLSRFVTSFCAPGFFMLMGWGVALFIESRRRLGWSWTNIFKHFFLRGLVLLVLNDLMMIPFRPIGFGYVFATSVLFALGVGIFLASVFIYLEELVMKGVSKERLPVYLGVMYFSIATFLTIIPSLYVPRPEAVNEESFSFWFLFWFLPMASPAIQTPIFSIYPVVPWLAHTLWGVGIGRVSKLVSWDPPRLGLVNLICGISMLAVAIPLRYAGNWTSINPELVVPPIQSSVISFFNNVKYPPSVVYTLITIGANHMLLGFLFIMNPKVDSERGLLMVYGGSSLFFYVTHFYTYATMKYLLTVIGVLPEGGFGDGVFWIWYLVGLVLEYYMCMRYAEFKRTTSKDSLWRLF